MSTNSNFDRIAEAWLADGPTQLADRVLEAALDEVHLTRQRRRLPVLWRFSPMPVHIRLAAVAVIGMLLVGVIYLNLPGRNDVGPTLSPSPSPIPNGSPIALPEGTLTAGRYRIQPSLSTWASLRELPSLTITADIPAGWDGAPVFAALGGPGEDEKGTLVGFMRADRLFSDPCHWDVDGTGAQSQPGDVEVGPTVDDLVTALRANTSYTASTPSPVTVGGFQGSELELRLPGEDVMSTCDRFADGEQFSGTGYLVFPGGFYDTTPNGHWHLYVVDVDGIRLITLIAYSDATPPADVAAAEAIVESLEITP